MKQILLWMIEYSRTFLIIYGIAFFVILAIIIENTVSPGYTQNDANRWLYMGNIALIILMIATVFLLLLRYLYFGGMLPVE
jgi:hypothetical protein